MGAPIPAIVDGNRQTGRTTLMLQRVTAAVSTGQRPFVVAANDDEAKVMRVMLVRMGAPIGRFHVVTLADSIAGAELVFFDHHANEVLAQSLTRENMALKVQLGSISEQLQHSQAASGELVRALAHLVDTHTGGSIEIPKDVLDDSGPRALYRKDGEPGFVVITTAEPEEAQQTAEGGDDNGSQQ